MFTSTRRERERNTIETMIAIYCRAHHGAHGGHPCAERTALADYARQRLEKCPFHGPSDGACARTACTAPAASSAHDT